jgi:hypothetical protein
MNPIVPDPESTPNGQSKHESHSSIVDDLKLECERLQQIAERLKVREKTLSEMEANYPYLKEFVYAWMRKNFASQLDEIPLDKDLETFAKEEGALPLEAFIREFEELEEAS